MSWQNISPKSNYSERKTNFLNNSGKSGSFNSTLGNSSKDGNPLGKSLSSSTSNIQRPNSAGPSPNKVPLHLQKLKETRKRGVTVASTSSDDSVETRRMILLGSKDGSEEPMIKERSKSYEVLPSWDYTPFTFKLNQESAVDEYIHDDEFEDDQEEEMELRRTPQTTPQSSPSTPSRNSNNNNSNNNNNNNSSANSTPIQSPSISNNMSPLSMSSSSPSKLSPITLGSSLTMDIRSSSDKEQLSPISASPLTASMILNSQSSDLIPIPLGGSTKISLTSSGSSMEYSFTTTIKLNYEKHPDDSNKFIVVSGEKNQLLEYLCNKNKLDIQFVNTFILTFRYYIGVNDLFEFLISKFYIKAPTTSSSKVSKQFDEILDKIKQNVIIILSIWVDSNFSDFQDDPDLYSALLEFTNEVNSKVLKDSIDRQSITKFNIIELYETMKSELLPLLLIQSTSGRPLSSSTGSNGSTGSGGGSASISLSASRDSNNNLKHQDKNSVFVSGQQIIDWIKQYCNIGNSTAENIFKKFIKIKVIASVGGFVSFSGKIQKEYFFFVNIETPVLKTIHSKQFLDYAPQDIAKQLALMEFKVFQQIKMKEIYFKSWTIAKSKFESSPNVMKLITNSNKIANWVATEVVTTPHPKKRVEVLKRMITIAEYCKKFNNFNSLMEIVSGLNNSSVIRLKETWKSLPSKYCNSLNSLQNFLNTNENWKLYRQALKTHQIPCLPYLGLFLQDINFVEDGNANTLDDDIEHVNFKKMLLLSNVFSEIQFYQKHPYYTFTNQPHIQLFLEKDLIILPEKELYDFSKFIESPTNPLNKLNKYIS